MFAAAIGRPYFPRHWFRTFGAIVTLLKWGFFVILVLTNTWQFYCYRTFRAAWERMPVVAALILRSELRNYNDVDGERVFEPDIRFSYRFRGKDYEANTPCFEGPTLGPQWDYAATLVKKYEVGEYYNARVLPTEPPLAYLELAPLSKLAAIGLPLLTLGYGIYLFLFFFGFDLIFE